MTDLRIFLRPDFEGPDRGEGGIRRWVEAQRRYLPEMGFALVPRESDADVVVCHAMDLVDTSKPLVTHCHGLYNTAAQEWDRWAWMANRNVCELLRRADIATVPSAWVAMQVARGLNVRARVLYAGIEPDMWAPGTNRGYVLWNKTRVDPVCDPTPVMQLAARNPDLPFVTTFGQRARNVLVTGKLPYEKARDLVRDAGVYLSTSRETFGIATIEAMACGVPVLGYAWGGNRDIVRHGDTGYLATPGDVDDLQRGLEACLANRDEWGAAARADVLERFTWRRAMEECAAMYREAAGLLAPRPRVSIIVTCYDLERYLPECLRSVQRQTSRDWECIVVDDCSPGNCREIVESFAREDPRFRYERSPRNLYLAAARNYGIARSSGRYILPLDADDQLGERAVAVLGDFLDATPGAAIAYGAMQVIEDGKEPFVSGWPMQFNWAYQMNKRNMLPYASMYRRWVWERTGGYRERCTTAEDADFWCRVTSFGARPVKATDYPTLIYRNRPDSMSHTMGDVAWTEWYPWARDRRVTPFGSVGDPPNKLSWPVATYEFPLVSVVIPVGPGHERLVIDALDSVLAQTMPRWEVIVVNDTGAPLDLAGFPWARVFETPAPASGPSVARNVGASQARGEFLLFLDADDYLLPGALERMLEVQKECGGYVYCDWFEVRQDGTSERKESPDFELSDLLFKGLPWTVVALIPRWAYDAIGGFDESVRQWEDWDLFFALGTQEICGTRVPEPLFCYRYWSGARREGGYAEKDVHAKAFRRKWARWTRKGGEKFMACGSCSKGGGKKVASAAPSTNGNGMAEATTAAATGEMVYVEYNGEQAGIRTYIGLATRTRYRFGDDPSHKRRFVYQADAEEWRKAGRLGDDARFEFRIVPPEARRAVPPAAEPPAVRQRGRAAEAETAHAR